MAKIIDGRAIGALVRQDLKLEIEELVAAGVRPGLAVILVGEDPASQSYVKNKERTSIELGIHSEVYRLPASTTQDELLRRVAELNSRPEIHGILVQLPLPDHINEQAVIHSIAVEKDVDGFHPINVGNLLIGAPCYVPCTPNGVMEMLDRTGVDLKGKKVAVVGRSNIVGKPVALLLLSRHATVTICHSRTVDLPAVIGSADVLVVAVGKPEMVKGAWVKEGAVVIDVGVNRVGKKLVGDVEFEAAAERASAITPVPGGVGPMTITMLMKNTIESARRTLKN